METATEGAQYVVGKATPLAASAAENLTTLAEYGKAKIGVLVDPAELERLRRIEVAARDVVTTTKIEAAERDRHLALDQITVSVLRLEKAINES